MTVDPGFFVGDDGRSLYGSCSRCQRSVDNHDPLHRVTPILRGGRGVECVLRGDITHAEAMPLGLHVARRDPRMTHNEGAQPVKKLALAFTVAVAGLVASPFVAAIPRPKFW